MASYNVIGEMSRRWGADASLDLVEDNGATWSLATSAASDSLTLTRDGSTYAVWKGDPSGAVLGGSGTSTTPTSTSTANSNFLGYWVKNTAATGDTRGIYMRLYVSGAGAGEAGRFYTTVNADNAATGGTVNGVHASLSVATGGSISGTGHALRATLDVADSVTAGGSQLSSIQCDTNFGTSAVVPADTSFITFNNVGAAPTTNGAPYLFNIQNPNTSTMFVAATNSVIDHALKIRVGGVDYWIGLYDATS